MAKKGDIARETAKDIILAAFGDSVAGIQDKKIYINMADGGETVQLAISMTMPKTPLEAAGNTTTSIPTPATMPTELSSEDQNTVDMLMKRLGLK